MWIAWLSIAAAGDTWTNIRPGVDYLHRTSSEPQDIYAARIDLSLPNIALHASANNDQERGVNTREFADAVGALVAINTDWSNGYTPVGLAISEGSQWHDHIHDDTLGSRWGVVGCTIGKDCSLFVEQPLDTAWWFSAPLISPYRFHHATGANGIPMVLSGVAQSGCYDSSDNPRSAICLEADGVHMWLIVVDGRSGSAAGMSCNEIRSLMLDLGCYDGLMLDGGGSSTLVIEGDVKNNPSDGSLRTVSNHLAVLYRDNIDASCVTTNGKWCEGSTIHACQGGQRTGSGDCAAYGATCQEDGDYAFCVDYRCPGGDGLGAACLDATRISSCTDGQYGEGDCATFGLACGSDAGGTSCMDARCPSPDGSVCVDSTIMIACTDGTYGEIGCAAGTSCAADELGAYCSDDRCAAAPACVGSVYQSCARGVFSEIDCATLGQECGDQGCFTPGSGDSGGGDGAGDSGAAGDSGTSGDLGLPGEPQPMPAGGCSGEGGDLGGLPGEPQPMPAGGCAGGGLAWLAAGFWWRGRGQRGRSPR